MLVWESALRRNGRPFRYAEVKRSIVIVAVFVAPTLIYLSAGEGYSAWLAYLIGIALLIGIVYWIASWIRKKGQGQRPPFVKGQPQSGHVQNDNKSRQILQTTGRSLRGFLYLLLIAAGVAVYESLTSPSSKSLIPDIIILLTAGCLYWIGGKIAGDKNIQTTRIVGDAKPGQTNTPEKPDAISELLRLKRQNEADSMKNEMK
jgi:hypothetical protein